MKEAISGSSGFIGSRLSERLPGAIKLDRTGELPENIDLVYDLASYGNMAHHENGEEIFKANVLRVLKLLESDARFILTSSLSVKLPNKTLYSSSKEAVENIARVYASEGKKVCVVRPASITGVGEQQEHLIPKLIDSCLNGTEMPFVKEPVHDFLDVDDFVGALLTIRDKGQFVGEVYEIGTGIQFSNDEIRVLVEKYTGKKANIKLVDSMRSYDTKDWKANIERIYSLGWSPQKGILQTIQEMVDHERKNT
jgi:nucleoside-diphosphate-sugar epimerase